MRAQSIPEILSPPLSPPSITRGPQRNMAKTSALKLITSFGDKTEKSKFFGVGEDERTPIGGVGVTPIAESALSPGGGDTAHTAFLRPSHRSAYNTPASARTATPGGFTRQRLPSIGEMPSDVVPIVKADPARLPTPADSGSEVEKATHQRKSSQPETLQLSAATYSQPTSRAATASPMTQKKHLSSNTLPSPSPDSFSLLKQDARTRNGSRDRKPDGLQIQWPPMESIITGDYMTSPQFSLASSRHRTPAAPSVAGSVTGSVSSVSSAGAKYDSKSPMASERSYKSYGTHSPVVTGRSLDQYISSLESAHHHAQKQRKRQASSDRHEDKHGRGRSGSRKPKGREPSEDRGRSGARYIKAAKRSPTSPVPMSPEDFRELGADGYGYRSELRSPMSESKRTRDESQATAKPGSKASSRVRRLSIENLPRLQTSKPPSKVSSRTNSRRQSPDGLLSIRDGRGRSKGRESSAMRSPSSPLPMSPQAKYYQADDDEEDLAKSKEELKRFRSKQRSTSRMRERGTSARRDPSPDRRRRDRSVSRKPATREGSRTRESNEGQQPIREERQVLHSRTMSEQKAGDLHAIRSERAIKKEMAARELEERRKSLALRPSVPPIVHPEEIARLSPAFSRSHQNSPDFQRSSTYPSPSKLPPRSQTTSPNAVRISPNYNRNSGLASPQIGLPATPRAMRHPKYDPDGNDVPDVPQIPESFEPGPPIMASLTPLTYNSAFENLGPLPKTTYQATPRHMPPRSMSAPIPEEPPASPHALPAALPTHPAFQSALPPSSRRRTQDMSGRQSQIPPSRKINPGESQPGMLGYETRNNTALYSAVPTLTMVGIDETIEANTQPINPSNDNLTPPPPPPPPAPPILKELQHLAMPPPPPPPPMYLPGNPNTNSMTSGVSQGSGVIEIVMDSEAECDAAPQPAQTQPLSSPTLVTETSMPPPSHSRTNSISHNRGRSVNDNSLSGRFSRATERIRSASRGRKDGGSPVIVRTLSPQEVSPYDVVNNWGSISETNIVLGPGRSVNATPATERHPREVVALPEGHVYMEGGMI
jgi:hypothetical protein